jgi:hypothetical protein
MEMDSYKSQILDGVLMGSGTKTKIVRAGVSNCMRQCLNFFRTKCTHSRIPGLKGEALFLELNFFLLCLPIVD